MATIEIYGLKCNLPPKPKDKDIAGYGITFRKQKFVRTELPESFDELSVDDQGNAIYSDEQQVFINRELNRCIEGYWFFNKGEPTYITGDHYYYITWWTLENGITPEYRDADRRWFLFFKEVQKDPYILGVIRVKKRREGASNQSSCLLVRNASMGVNIRCGIISKTGRPDAADLFSNMVVNGFRSLPPFLQPRTSSDEDPAAKLVFMKAGEKKRKGVQIVKKREGLNSFIEWRNTAPNSFDSGRWTVMLVDEAGKYPFSIVEYWNTLKKVLVEGKEKVGTAIVVSTVNPPNLGGAGFLNLWEDSNQFTQGPRTKTRLVRYFVPAWDGYAGCIDEWGFSQKEEAVADIMENWRNNEQDIRDYPLTEQEAFQFAQSESPFSIENIDAQLSALKENPVYIRTGRLIWNDKQEVDFVDDPKGNWHIYKLPNILNRFTRSSGQIMPGNVANYVGGVDPFRLNDKGSYSSTGTICIFQHLDASDPDNSGMPVAIYKGRPKDKELFFDEALKAFMFYGCKGTFEIDATDDFIKYFRNRFASNLLNWTPDAVISPHKKKKLERGVRSADPFALEKQLQVTILYVENHCHKIMYPELLEDLKRYDHTARTKSDLTVAMMMALLTALGTSKGQAQEKKKTRMVETFKVRI